MKTELFTPVRDGEPLSSHDRTRGGVACAMSMMRDKFPGIVPVASALDSSTAAAVGADWIVDVYFLPSRRAMSFEDLADELSVSLADELGVQTVFISHTEEATQEYYMEILEKCCPFELEHRGPGIAITNVFATHTIPQSWFLSNPTAQSYVIWSELQTADDRTFQEAA